MLAARELSVSELVSVTVECLRTGVYAEGAFLGLK